MDPINLTLAPRLNCLLKQLYITMPSALRRLNQHSNKLKLIFNPKANYSTQLAKVGKFEAKQADENCYAAGQPFLHRIFGYRGVTLFPWLARVHDIDLRKQYSNDGRYQQQQESNKSNEQQHDANMQAAVKYHPYYQVLIDTRDCPYVSNRTQTEAVTFLGHPDNSKSVYSIKGLDYVAHEDILPYTSLEDQPIHHELHKKLFQYNPVTNSETSENDHTQQKFRFSPSDLLDSWRNKHPWLELSRVYKETTENVRVTVIPFYLGHTTIEDTSFHWWRYCVRLENFGDYSVQLRERHWKIFSQTNMLQTIKGRGVVGVEPLLSKSEPAYQYSSHVNLQDKSGHMWGTFKLQREDGHTFECRIPPFSLESSIDPVTPPSSKRFDPTDDDHHVT